MDDIYYNIEKYNLAIALILIAFHDMIADMISKRNPIPIVTEIFIRGRKLNISFNYYTVIL